MHSRLQGRRAEIEQAMVARVYGVSDSIDSVDAAYLDGLRAAVSAALDYGLAAIELGDEDVPPVPTSLLTQARAAAHDNIGLDIVLRRYFAGYALLSDFLAEEAEGMQGLEHGVLKCVLRTQALTLDRLVAAVSEEHARESESRMRTSEERLAKRVQRLLAGELVDTSDLAYDFDACHLAAIVVGSDAAAAARSLAGSLGSRLLLVCRDETSVWAWFGGLRPLASAQLTSGVSGLSELAIAVGEPSRGMYGWRISHQQAQAALPIALRSPGRLVRYFDVALLASLLQDDLLAGSLREFYLEPLAKERDGGEALRETLRAYFSAERNVSSTAAALGVSRRTVANRLRMIEAKLGRPLGQIAAEIEVALRLQELDHTPTMQQPTGGVDGGGVPGFQAESPLSLR